MARLGVFVLFIFLASCGAKPLLPNMEPGETGRVVKIIDGDALVLESGQSVRLVSIEAPVLYPRDRSPDAHAAESARALEDMALGRQVQLFYPGLTRDHYDRALAHVVTTDGRGPQLWLNAEMVERGAARVRLYPDTAARGDELLVMEADARAERRGIWATSRYALQDAAVLPETVSGFRFVRAELGEILPLEDETRFAPACRRALLGAVFKLDIRRDARTACGLADGTVVEIRGRVREGVLELTYPRHLQILSPD
ncbi:MAG: thermonuclease family protein [Pseudomonadota bacterium]